MAFFDATPTLVEWTLENLKRWKAGVDQPETSSAVMVFHSGSFLFHERSQVGGRGTLPISIWLRYTEIMGVLPAETGGTRTLNVFLPFLVALEPYLFNLMGYSSILIDVVTVAYALDIGTIYAILAGFNGILSSKGRGLVEPALIRKYRAIRTLQILVAMVFWVSILPQFYTVGLTVRALTIPLRFLFWILTIGISRGTWILRRAGRL